MQEHSIKGHPPTYVINLDKIHLLQKRISIREYRVHSAPLFAKFKGPWSPTMLCAP